MLTVVMRVSYDHLYTATNTACGLLVTGLMGSTAVSGVPVRSLKFLLTAIN